MLMVFVNEMSVVMDTGGKATKHWRAIRGACCSRSKDEDGKKDVRPTQELWGSENMGKRTTSIGRGARRKEKRTWEYVLCWTNDVQSSQNNNRITGSNLNPVLFVSKKL